MINTSLFSTMMGSSNTNKKTTKVAPKSVSTIKSRMTKSSTDNAEKKNKDEFNSYKVEIFKRMDKINDILSKNIQLKKDEQKADKEIELEKKKELFSTKKIKTLSSLKPATKFGLSFLVGFLYEKILDLIKYLTNLLEKWHDQIKNIFTEIQKIYDDVVSTITTFATGLIDSIQDTYNMIYDWGINLYNSIAKFFNLQEAPLRSQEKKSSTDQMQTEATNTNNNPGNIMAGNFATNHGATGKASNGVATFPDQATGDAAHHALLSSKSYSDLSLKDIPKKYAPKDDGKDSKLKGNDPGRYTKQLQKFAEFDDETMEKTYPELTPAQQVTFRNAQSRVEGTSKQSTGSSAGTQGAPGSPDDISIYGNIAGLVKGSGFVNGVPEAISGGRANKETIEAAQMIANDSELNLRSRKNFRFTAFDDAYHRKERGNSGHTKGKAFDIAFDGASPEDAKKITELLAGTGTATFEAASRGGSTGDHIHVEIFPLYQDVEKSESATTQIQTSASGAPSVAGVYNPAESTGKTSAEKLAVTSIGKQPQITNIDASKTSSRENVAELPSPNQYVQLTARDPHMGRIDWIANAATA